MTPVIHVVLPDTAHRSKLPEGCNRHAKLARLPPAQQTTRNANRIAECMASYGWIKARRRVGNRSTRVYAFFPDEVDKVPPVL